VLARLHLLSRRVANSLWATPLAAATFCAALAITALRFEPPWVSDVAWLYGGDSAQARDFASSLVAAMITLTALAFSITMVVLALAAQQLGPRLIQIFMSDRGTQAALGLFIGTVVYLLLVLHALDGGAGDEPPKLAIPIGTVLVFACVATLLVFVHSLARSIVSDHVVARVGADLDAAIAATFPKDEAGDSEQPPQPGEPVHLDARGYVQRIDYGALVKAAAAHDGRLLIAYRAGAHVVDGEPHAWTSECCADDLRPAIGRAVVISRERTEGQDPAWSVRQLVEVGLRALSPGVNDVFTSIAVIDRLTCSLAMLTARSEAPRVWRDSEGAARVFGPSPTFELMLDAAYDQIRESGADKQRVLLRLAEGLGKLAALAGPRHEEALRRHLELLARTARRGIVDDVERAEVEAEIGKGLAALGEAGSATRRASTPAVEGT
jgi:uncharacterized membrane protein